MTIDDDTNAKIPVSKWHGRWLCRLGLHRWRETGTRTVVIPTGNALLVKQQTRATICARRDCTARRETIYNRDANVG